MPNAEPEWSHGDYQRMHMLEAECARLTRMVEDLESEEAALKSRLLDLEAEHFADKLEREIDLQTWDGLHAAHVGHDLEELADRLMASILAYSRGEDVYAALYDIHGDMCCLMADISTSGEEG